MSDLLPPQDKVLTFNINSYLVIQSADNFPPRSLTFSAWISWVPPKYQNPEFLSYATSPGSATILNYNESPDGSGDSPRFWVTDLTNVSLWINGSSLRGTRPIDASDGNWHHITATVHDSGGGKYAVELFHNGQSAARGSIDAGQSLVPGGRLVLGQRFWGDANDQFIGQFASVAFFNRVRTATEIMEEFNNGLSGNEPGLAIYWKLDKQPEGVDAQDLTFVDLGGEDFGFDFGS